VSARDVADLVTQGGFSVARSQIALNAPIKMIGQHKVAITLHPEVEVNVTIVVARNAEEAERVKRGEDVTIRREDAEVAREQALAAAETFFDPEAQGGDDEAETGGGDGAQDEKA
jgi:large subunit ribosomal protein L9